MKAAEITRIFARAEPLRGLDQGAFEITPLPGYTNHNYRLLSRDQDWVLRLPRAATNVYVDREAEAFNQARAADLGLAPRPRWRDRDGATLTPTLAATRSCSRYDLIAAESRERLLRCVQKLHRSNLRFRGRVDLAALLERYYSLLDAAQRPRFANRLFAARELLPLLEDRDLAYVPSHNDLVLENLLLGADQPWLIDWEFSAMASPYWDLATLCNAAELDYAESRALLLAYCNGGPTMEESLLFDYRSLLKLLADIWMAALVD